VIRKCLRNAVLEEVEFVHWQLKNWLASILKLLHFAFYPDKQIACLAQQQLADEGGQQVCTEPQAFHSACQGCFPRRSRSPSSVFKTGLAARANENAL